MSIDPNTKVTSTGAAYSDRMQELMTVRDRTVSENSTLSGNFVLEFARIRLDQIDSSLTRQLNRMKDCQAKTAAVNDVMAVVSQFSGGITTSEDKEALKKAFTDAIAKLPEGSPLARDLTAMRDAPNALANVGNDDVISEPEMSAMKSKLEGMSKKIDAAQQEEQLTVNLRLGQRNEVLQLAATLIQSMNETVKGIIGRS